MTPAAWLTVILAYVIVSGAVTLGLARAAGRADDRVPGLRAWEAEEQVRAIRAHRRRRRRRDAR